LEVPQFSLGSIADLRVLAAVDRFRTKAGFKRRCAPTRTTGAVAWCSSPTQSTGWGHALARELVAIGPGISRETLEGLSEKEQRDLLRLLDRLGQKG